MTPLNAHPSSRSDSLPHHDGAISPDESAVPHCTTSRSASAKNMPHALVEPVAMRLWSVRDSSELAHGYGFDEGMRLAAELGYGLNAFRGRGTMTPFLGTRSRAGGCDLPLGVG